MKKKIKIRENKKLGKIYSSQIFSNIMQDSKMREWKR